MSEEEKKMLSFIIDMIRKLNNGEQLTLDEYNTLDDIQCELGYYDSNNPRPFRGY